MSGTPTLPSGLNSSPIKYSVQGSQRFAASPIDAKAMKNQLASELHCHWVGPMPVDEFFETFLNIDQKDLTQMPSLPDDYFGALLEAKQESEMYQPFIELVTNSHTAPTLKLFDTSEHPDLDAEKTMKNKPDVTAYTLNADITPARPLSYSQAELIFELKPRSKPSDPFQDLSKEATDADLDKFLWEAPAEARRDCRGQVACYARAWMASQHRTHCFVVWIGDPWARIIRFDRSGAIVTERFNFRSRSRLLLQFLWRFSSASAEMRGHDTTVSVVTDPDEVKLAQEKLKQWEPQRPRRVMKFKIPNGAPPDKPDMSLPEKPDMSLPEKPDMNPPDKPDMREVLVWGPLADPYCVVGRATRGYPGWDLKDEKLVFVKDSWRVIGADMSKEIDILKTLNKAEVCHVPTFLSGDDLPGQTTRTQDLAGADWNMGGKPEVFSKRAHIRFTTDTIGIPLVKFKRSKDFVLAWLDALLAHEEAYRKCKILHRDISLNNILLRPEGGGFLNDWDLARTLDDIETGPRQPSRSGTWQFMSIDLLGKPDKKHTLQDDLEGFFWVLLYVTIRYLLTSLVESGASVRWTMQSIFDMTTINGHLETLGGDSKHFLVVERRFIGQDFQVSKNAPLSVLINSIINILSQYLFYLKNFQNIVREHVEDDDMTVEEATEVVQSKVNASKFNTHVAMVAFTRKAIGKEWPTDDASFDYCATSSTSTGTTAKRPAPGNPPNVGFGTEYERETKRAKKDGE